MGIPSILLTNDVNPLSEANKLTGEIINHAGIIKSMTGAKLINCFTKFPSLLKLEYVFYIKPRILKGIHHVAESILSETLQKPCLKSCLKLAFS